MIYEGGGTSTVRALLSTTAESAAREKVCPSSSSPGKMGFAHQHPHARSTHTL